MTSLAKTVVVLALILIASSSGAADKFKLYGSNLELTKMIEMYSKASGQKFVVDPTVRGKASIFIQENVSLDEAFNLLSSSLALNGFAISKQGDTMIVKSARNIQRDLIEVSTTLPPLKPERMATWIFTAKNVPAENINKNLRILPSRDGELNISLDSNQLIITDWTSNLHRISEILKVVDVKTSQK